MTTHSVEDSGLLEALVEAFSAEHPTIRVMATAVGSGAALELGRRGDADVLLTHDPAGERRFMEEGHGVERRRLMANRYLIVGPASDPAGIAGGANALAALTGVAEAGATFLSRGDDSGTHRKERELWAVAGLQPWLERPAWYVEAGLGMAETLQTGAQIGAYLLTDEATFLHLRRLDLEPLVSGDRRLENPYTYTLPARPRNPDGARVFVDWLMGPGQRVIASYGTDRFGQPLFAPAEPEDESDPWS